MAEEIWDGNGGTLDPAKATQRDMLVALHTKMDNVVVPALKELRKIAEDHEKRIRDNENGTLTLGQQAAIRTVIQGDADARVSRRNLKAPIWALLISGLALITSIVLTVQAFTGGQL